MKRKLGLILLLLVVTSCFFVPVGAGDYPITVDSYATTNQNDYFAVVTKHPSPNASRSAAGQSFTATQTVNVTNVSFYLRKSGAPVPIGQSHAVIYAHSGVYGVSSVPTGAALATSEPYDISALTTSYQVIQFNFTNPVELQAYTYYTVCFQAPTVGTLNPGNYVLVGSDNTPGHSGNSFTYLNSAYSAVAAQDTIFYVNGIISWNRYIFSDTYYENGTLCVPPINVTATGPGFIESFNTSGGTTQYYPVEPERFQWTIADGVSTATRRIYSIGEENFTVTYPESTFDTFVFTVRDFTNKLAKGDAYLEAWRIINAVDTLVERQIIDVHNEVPLNLVIGATYTIRVRFYDGSLLTWGAFVPGETTTFTIVLRGVSFTDQAYQVANFIFVEIARPTGTTFTVDYEATKNQTIWANVTIMIRNGAIIDQVSRTNNSFVYNYAGALANTSYVVLVEGVHTLRRDWGYTRIFDATETYPDVPDMGSIFPMGDMDTTSLIGWVLTIASGLTFSLVYRRAALLAMGTIGSLVTVFGFTDWSYYLLAFVWFFGIVVYLGSGEKG